MSVCVLHYTRAVLFLLLLALSMQSGRAAHAAKEKPTRDATLLEPRSTILRIFDKYPLVAISEAHGMREEADFIASLIRHPQFVEKVNDIVLEAGNWRYQPILDRYMAGDAVPIEQLRLVWREHTCSALGPRDSSNLEQLLATVRAVNLKLLPEKQLRVLAGDPPINWNRVHTAEELSPWLAQREIHCASVVEEQVLAKGHKALLIIGGVHLERKPLPNNDPRLGVMLQILEARYPGKTFIVIPHEGFSIANQRLEKRMASWPRPSLVFLKDTWLGDIETRDLQVLDIVVDEGGDRVLPGPERQTLADKADAYLYLGPGETLTMEPRDSALFLDDVYFNELNRRHKLAHGRELDWNDLMKPRPKKWADNFKTDVFFHDPSKEIQMQPLR